MLLPFFGFFFALILFGGVASAVVTADKYAADKAPAAYALLCAGLGGLGLTLAAGALGYLLAACGLAADSFASRMALLSAPPAGLAGGALLGRSLGLAHRRRRAALLPEWYERDE